jgi:hypothetical protein
MPQFSCGDLAVIQAELNLGNQRTLEVLIGSTYMPYDSVELSPQDEIKKLVAYAEERGTILYLY